jgi:phage portal protein BeeE
MIFEKQITRLMTKAIRKMELPVPIVLTGYGDDLPVLVEEDLTRYITGIFEVVPDLYAIIDYITDLAKVVPVEIVKWRRGEEVAVLDDHDFWNVIEKPNPLMGYHDLVKTFLTYYLTIGNAYLVGLRPVGFKHAWGQLWVAPADYMRVIPNEEGRRSFMEQPVKKYRLEFDHDYDYDPEVVFHMKNINLNYNVGRMFYGMSPLLPAQRITRSLSAGIEAKAGQLANRGALGMITPTEPNAFIDPQQDIKTLKWRYYQIQGVTDGKDNMLFSSIPLNYNSISLPLKDLQIIENLKYDLQALCRVYRFPSALLNDEEGTTYNNIVEKRKQAYTASVKPLLDSFYYQLSMFIFGSTDIKVRARWTDVPEMQPDQDVLSRRLTTEFDRGIWTPNELRAALGGSRVEQQHMDCHFIHSNYVRLEQLSTGARQELMEQLGSTGANIDNNN